MYGLAATFLVMSGAAALIYQVTWVRLLGLSMGSTSASLSTVLAAFFLGMAGGSYLAERITKNRIHSLRPYLALELCIGLAGLALLPLLLNLDAILAYAPAFGTTLALKFALVMTLLSVPTLCMGATFPVMAALMVRRHQDLGLRIGQLYSLNTVGAMLGAVLSAFVLVPLIGLNGAVYVAAALNLSIAVIGYLKAQHVTLPPLEHAAPASIPNPSKRAPWALPALIVLFATGMVSIATEVGWTKYLAIFTGTTLYGFAAILVVFLAGIALGSWWIKARLETITKPYAWMAGMLLAIGIALLFTRAVLAAVPAFYEGINHISAPGAIKQAIKYSFTFVMLFPATFLFGALFPLNLKLYCGDLAGVRQRVGRAYAVNTVAAILGSLAAGFWIIPTYGTDVLLVLCAALVLLLPLLFLRHIVSAKLRLGFALTALILIAISPQLPGLDYRRMIASVDYAYDEDARAGVKPTFLYLQEGKAAVISLVTYDDTVAKLQSNGLNESVLHMREPARSLIIENLLALVPYFLHPDPQSAFVVGFGGGVTTRAFTYTPIKKIHVVELEAAVIEAGRTLKNGPVTALNDARVTLDINDARNTLIVEKHKYDIIAAQPSHPWVAGAANVFTQEFFTIVRSRLNEGGIYSQWINLFRMDVATLQSLFKAFFNVFPYGTSFANIETGDFMLIGSEKPLTLDFKRVEARMQAPMIAKTLGYYDIVDAGDLVWNFALSRDEVLKAAGDATPNRDTNLLSEVNLSALTDDPAEINDPYDFLIDSFHFDLAPLLPHNDIVPRLYDAGLRFLWWNVPKIARKIVTRLENYDAEYARALHHAVLRYEAREDEATALYKKHATWPNDTHARQARIYADLHQYDAARAALLHITDLPMRRAATALLLAARGQWGTLAQIHAQDKEERAWQLAGAALSGAALDIGALRTALESFHKEALLIRAGIAYFARTGLNDEADVWSRRLTDLRDRDVTRLSGLAYQAIDNNEKSRALQLCERIAHINPKADVLDDLRYQTHQLDTQKVAKN
ncbi:MAG: fused MFS/spermidine synthase [Pseudomonadota bacterium]